MKLSLGTLVPALVIALAASSSMAAEIMVDLPNFGSNEVVHKTSAPPTVKTSTPLTVKTSAPPTVKSGSKKTTSVVTRVGGVEVIEENIAAPLVVRISKIKATKDLLILEDVRGTNRFSIWKSDLTLKYSNSQGLEITAGWLRQGIGRGDVSYLDALAASVHPGCPVDVTIDRQTLAIQSVKNPFCEETPVNKFLVVSQISDRSSVSLFDARSKVILSVYASDNTYKTILPPNEWMPLSPEVVRAIFRAALGVSAQCPVEISLDSITGRLKRIKTTCDSLAQAPYQDNMG